MSAAPNYFKFHLGDFARDCEELSMLQEGAYLRLMRWYYSTGKPIPNDLARIHRRTFATSVEERSAVDYILTEFFRLDGAVWRHKRIDEELASWTERSDMARRSVMIREIKKSNKINETATSVDDKAMIDPSIGRSSNQNQNQNHRTTRSKALVPTLSSPSQEHRQQAQSLGINPDAEWDRYVDWLAATGTKHKSREAGFRNWLRRAATFKTPAKQTAHDARATVAAAIFGTQPQQEDDHAAIVSTATRIE